MSLDIECLYSRTASRKRKNWSLLDGRLRIRNKTVILFGAEDGQRVENEIDGRHLQEKELKALKEIGYLDTERTSDDDLTIFFSESIAAIVAPKESVKKNVNIPLQKFGKFKKLKIEHKKKPLHNNNNNEEWDSFDQAYSSTPNDDYRQDDSFCPEESLHVTLPQEWETHTKTTTTTTISIAALDTKAAATTVDWGDDDW